MVAESGTCPGVQLLQLTGRLTVDRGTGLMTVSDIK